jgi:predicted N-acetyltransferase YhbS
MPRLEFRLLKSTDAEAAVALLVKVFSRSVEESAAAEIRRMFSHEKYRPHFIGAFESRRLLGLVGVVNAAFMMETYGLGWMAVTPERQRQGIGSQLVEEAVRFTEQKLLKGTRGQLLVGAWDDIRGYYDKAGFKDGLSLQMGNRFMGRVLNGKPSLAA